MRPDLYFFRDAHGNEVDLLIRKSGKLLPVEIKSAAIVERDDDWFIAYCPEISGANGQGKTKDECLKNLSQAIDLILEDRREDALRGIPSDASQEMVPVGG